MKKMIIALMCAAMTVAASAQPKNDNKPCPQGGEQGAKPCCMMQQQPQQRHQMRPGKRGFRPQASFRGQTIDMPVIKSLDLDSATINAVRTLKKKQTEEMHALIADMRPDNMPRPEMKKDAPGNADKKEKKDDKKAKKDRKDGKKDKDMKKPDMKKAPEGQCCNNNGKGDSKENREALKAKMKENREKMKAFRKACNAELRKTLGDEKYIEYLEKKQEAFYNAPRGPRR